MSRPQVGEGFLLVQQTTQLGNSLIRLFEVTVTKFEVSAELVSVWAAWKNRHDPHASIDIQQSKGVELCVPHISHGQTTTSHLCDPPVEPLLEASNGLLCVPRWAVLHLPGWSVEAAGSTAPLATPAPLPRLPAIAKSARRVRRGLRSRHRLRSRPA